VSAPAPARGLDAVPASSSGQRPHPHGLDTGVRPWCVPTSRRSPARCRLVRLPGWRTPRPSERPLPPRRAGRKLARLAAESTAPQQLVIKVTAGADGPERCSQAFTVAAVAAASGVHVSLWLTGESAWFALPGRAAEFELPHAAPLPDLISGIQASGRIT